MPNPFDKFDEQPNSANPFDQFDGPSARPSWSQALGNIPSDISKTVEEVKALPGAALRAGQAIIEHPVDTAIAGGKAVVGGLVNQGRQIAGALTGGAIGMSPEEYNATVVQPSRKQAIERPLTTVANIALSGLPSGELTAGQAALKGITATTREVANLPTMALAGVGRKSLNATLEGGKLGGPEGAAALSQMRGGNPMPVAYDAVAAAKQLAADKNAAYLADAAQWKIPGQIADVNPVKQAHAAAVANNTMPLTGAARSAATQEALDKLNAIIEQHTTIPASRTPAGLGKIQLSRLSMDEMDALKQELGSVIHAKETPGVVKQTAGPIYDAAKQSAVTANPQYAGAMERSQQNIQRFQDLTNELSLKDKASKGTILRKLQSAMREDVNSGFRARSKMLDQLATKDPTLPYALAGQDLSAWMPRGLSRIFPGIETLALAKAAIHGGLGAILSPAALAVGVPLAAMSSPRLMGEARYGLGLLNRGAGKIGLTQKNIGRAGEAARVAGLLADPDRKPKGLLNP